LDQATADVGDARAKTCECGIGFSGRTSGIDPGRAGDSAVAGRVERSWISGPIVNDTIILAAGWTGLLSLIGHGASANPLVKRMAVRSADLAA
jgi:hypothetical protein